MDLDNTAFPSAAQQRRDSTGSTDTYEDTSEWSRTPDGVGNTGDASWFEGQGPRYDSDEPTTPGESPLCEQEQVEPKDAFVQPPAVPPKRVMNVVPNPTKPGHSSDPQKPPRKRKEPNMDKRLENTNPDNTQLYYALFDCQTQEMDELSFAKGDILLIVGKNSDGWWTGRLKNHQGLVPKCYLSPVYEPVA